MKKKIGIVLLILIAIGCFSNYQSKNSTPVEDSADEINVDETNDSETWETASTDIRDKDVQEEEVLGADACVPMTFIAPISWSVSGETFYAPKNDSGYYMSVGYNDYPK